MNDNLLDKSPRYYASRRQDMLKFVDFAPTAILEIGCGEGNFADNFKDAEYRGVEPQAAVAGVGAAKGRQILVGTYEETAGRLPERHFDLVVCNDVIEHMADPAGFLRAVRGKLAPGGKLIASIPNLRYAPALFDLVFRGRFDYTREGLLDYTHLHLFTYDSFFRMAADCGWRVETFAPVSVQPFKWHTGLLLKLFERYPHEMRTVQFAVRLVPGH